MGWNALRHCRSRPCYQGGTGYGRIRFRRTRTATEHQYIYMGQGGGIPSGRGSRTLAGAPVAFADGPLLPPGDPTAPNPTTPFVGRRPRRQRSRTRSRITEAGPRPTPHAGGAPRPLGGWPRQLGGSRSAHDRGPTRRERHNLGGCDMVTVRSRARTKVAYAAGPPLRPAPHLDRRRFLGPAPPGRNIGKQRWRSTSNQTRDPTRAGHRTPGRGVADQQRRQTAFVVPSGSEVGERLCDWGESPPDRSRLQPRPQTGDNYCEFAALGSAIVPP